MIVNKFPSTHDACNNDDEIFKYNDNISPKVSVKEQMYDNCDDDKIELPASPDEVPELEKKLSYFSY